MTIPTWPRFRTSAVTNNCASKYLPLPTFCRRSPKCSYDFRAAVLDRHLRQQKTDKSLASGVHGVATRHRCLSLPRTQRRTIDGSLPRQLAIGVANGPTVGFAGGCQLRRHTSLVGLPADRRFRRQPVDLSAPKDSPLPRKRQRTAAMTAKSSLE